MLHLRVWNKHTPIMLQISSAASNCPEVEKQLTSKAGCQIKVDLDLLVFVVARRFHPVYAEIVVTM